MAGSKWILATRLAGTTIRTFVPSMRVLRRLRSSIRSIDPHIIHSNGMKAHLLTACATRRHDNLIWHAHDFLSGRAMTHLLRVAARRVRRVIAISEAVASDARIALPGAKVRTVLNAVDLDQFTPGVGDPAVLGERPDDRAVRVGLVATYARWKGQEVFLDAIVKVRKSHPELAIRAYIIGGPIYSTLASQFSREELEARVEQRELGDVVRFIGFAENVAPIYRALDVVVHASTKPEPFGRTIAEAMACGRAVIVASGGGATELFTDGVDAIGFNPGDSGQLCEEIARLAIHGDLRRKLGGEAAATARSRFDRMRLGREIVAIYEGLNRDAKRGNSVQPL